jgi:putative glycerol-1-phosphate prenyltransferase
MRSSTIYEKLFSKEDRDKGIFVLLDPDRTPREKMDVFLEKLTSDKRVKAILVGTSLMFSVDFDEFVKKIKDNSEVPVIIFPGSSLQVSRYADALLFLSLISGRNPELLIGEHVRVAPLIKQLGVETIPTGYMLIDAGKISSVEFISNTKPIPRNKPDIAVAHAMAAELLGLKVLYLEAGSGAPLPIPEEIIKAVKDSVELPLIVGGGLRNRKDMQIAFDSGADYVVVGTALEERIDFLEEI